MTHDELVEKMCEADANTCHGAFPTQKWERKDAESKDIWRKGMSAALRVAVEEVLHVESAEEAKHAWASGWQHVLSRFIEKRRSRYLKPKRAEDRVSQRYTGGGCSVLFDGVIVQTFASEVHANRYVDGLIHELKNDSAK